VVTESAVRAHLDRLDARSFAAATTSEGRRWLASLAPMIDGLFEAWDVRLSSDTLRNGYQGLVLEVESSVGRPLVMKVVWPPALAVEEARALVAWDGRGTVELVDDDRTVGALLLERLDPATTLRRVPLVDAAEIAGDLLRRLAIQAPEGFPTLQLRAEAMADNFARSQAQLRQPVPPRWIDAGERIVSDLLPCETLLIHTDLHYDNVLAGDRAPWLAIDPKPIVGDPEFAIFELILTRADEVQGASGITQLLRTITAAGGMDPERAAGWAFLRSIEYWHWGLEQGLTEDPLTCSRIAGLWRHSSASARADDAAASVTRTSRRQRIWSRQIWRQWLLAEHSYCLQMFGGHLRPEHRPHAA
jgi:streptomycin 6-kinase